MLKNLRGGYKLIPLLISLAVGSVTVDKVYNSIKSTKKRIVLTGLSIDGELKNDISVDVIEEEDGLHINNVYGYDLLIKSDDSIVISEYVVTGKLYLHELGLNDESNVYPKITAQIISSISSKVTDIAGVKALLDKGALCSGSINLLSYQYVKNTSKLQAQLLDISGSGIQVITITKIEVALNNLQYISDKVTEI